MAFLRVFKKSELTDAELIARYKESSNNRFVGDLFMRYTHVILGVCMKYLKNEDDAQDAVMHIFEKLLIDLSKHEVQNFQAWLHTYTKNFCLMELRKAKTQRNRQNEIEEELPTFVESENGLHPTDKELLEVEIEKLEEAIGHLKDEQKVCIELFYLENKSYEEVSNSTGYDFKKVKSHIQNGKRNLKIILEKGE